MFGKDFNTVEELYEAVVVKQVRTMPQILIDGKPHRWLQSISRVFC